MKHLIIASMLTLSAAAAVAQPFEFQLRTGGPEHNFYEGTEGMHFAPVVPTGGMTGYQAWIEGANVDGIALNNFRGEIIESGPSRISLYEVHRDSPEGVAYRDYHDRYPADTDWDAVRRDYRMQQELAADANSGTGDS
jgi:hypothetical protein